MLRYGVCRFIFGLGVDKVTKFNPKDNMQLLSKPGAQLMDILLPTNYLGPYWTQESGQQPVEKNLWVQEYMFPTYHAINLPKIYQACSCIIPLKVKEKKHKSFWLIDVSKSQWDLLQCPQRNNPQKKYCPQQILKIMPPPKNHQPQQVWIVVGQPT